MSPQDLSDAIAQLKIAGFTNDDFTSLHHFSRKGRRVSMFDAIKYFAGRSSLKGANISMAQRCAYVAGEVRGGRKNRIELIREALAKWPLSESSGTPVQTRDPRSIPSSPRAGIVSSRTSAKLLGDEGEKFALRLLVDHGHAASLLPTNFPTYDIKVDCGATTFFVSVKTARERQHLRLGKRSSVERLSEGNYVFAFLATDPSGIRFTPEGYVLLILPAAEVREFAIPLHDAYWAAKGKPDGYTVMIKAYDRRHAELWSKWLRYQDAWAQLPSR